MSDVQAGCRRESRSDLRDLLEEARLPVTRELGETGMMFPDHCLP
jgi:hypothetical protein